MGINPQTSGFHAILAAALGSFSNALLIVLLFFALADIAFRVGSAVYYALIFFALALMVFTLEEIPALSWPQQFVISILLVLSGTLCLGLNQILVLSLDASWGSRFFLRVLLNAALALALTSMVIMTIGGLLVLIRHKIDAETFFRRPHLWWIVGTPLFLGAVTGGMFGAYEDSTVVSAGVSVIPHHQELLTLAVPFTVIIGGIAGARVECLRQKFVRESVRFTNILEDAD